MTSDDITCVIYFLERLYRAHGTEYTSLKFDKKFGDSENTNLCTIFQKESKISTIALTKVVSLLRANDLKIDNLYGGTLSDKNGMYSLLKYDVETNICY